MRITSIYHPDAASAALRRAMQADATLRQRLAEWLQGISVGCLLDAAACAGRRREALLHFGLY